MYSATKSGDWLGPSPTTHTFACEPLYGPLKRVACAVEDNVAFLDFYGAINVIGEGINVIVTALNRHFCGGYAAVWTL